MVLLVLSFVLLVASRQALPVTDAQGKYASAHVIQPKHMTTDEYVQSVIDFWTEEKFHQAKSPWELYPNMFNSSEIRRQKLDDSHFDKNTPAFAVNPVLGASDWNLKAPAGGYGRPTTGKVFWNLGNNHYGMCSASVIVSDNRDLLVTAAHCIFDPSQGGFLVNHNWVFVPGYIHGQRPYGTFPVRSMTTFNGWTNSNDWNYDIGYVLVFQVNGRHVQDVVGAQGIGFNFGRNELIFSFGYPLNLDGGEVMQYCHALSGGHQAGSGYHGQQLYCDMTGGSSGGPWLQVFNIQSGTGYVTSINSFLLSGQTNTMHGPYFGEDARSLYDSTKT
ncbi:unnamed protein product [Adineta steineri]|uniref:Peptidase S1 domain-containing protein n=2 Tax=Adineta steineri TaxID=433720 RepID=A0A815K7K9_9BILA|nr:unnamed protein product [Adineta steineri]